MKSSPRYCTRIGLSLATNSAQSVTVKITEKMISDQNARPLRRKLRQRRWFRGDSRITAPLLQRSANTPGESRRRRGRGSAPMMPCPSSPLPLLEINPRIDQHIHQVRQDTDHKANETEQEQRAEHHRVIAPHRRLEPQPPQTVERKDRLNQHRAAEEHADEHRRKARDHDQHGVAEHMPIKHPT